FVCFFFYFFISFFFFFFFIFFFFFFFFFFSSRRRHTRYWRDWSSDVCSSDLAPATEKGTRHSFHVPSSVAGAPRRLVGEAFVRSEERRVGKECRSRWSPYH